MKNKKTYIYVGTVITLVIILGIVIGFIIKKDNNENNINNDSNTNTINTITTYNSEIKRDDTNIEQKSKRGDEIVSNYDTTVNLNSLSFEGEGVTISNSTITIIKAGTYYFTGTLNNGNIVVNAGDDDNVILVFDNANITSSDTSVINGINAKNIYINIKEGTTTTFTDASNYTAFTEDDEPNATIFSKTDLIINGKGTLVINANYKDGIASKDDLVITNTNLQITANDDAIRGKDSVDIKDASITIKANGDGIKSNNDTDESKGYVIIDNSKVDITSEADAVQAETIIKLSASDLTIKTTGNIKNAEVSSKGLKAGKEITIESGNIDITSTDDSLHSNYYVIINGGTLKLSSGDDGIHADTNIIINNGTIDITKAYEGIEATYIEINNGKISVVASDDGLNASDGSGSTEFGGRGESFSSNSNVQLVINGGDIYVNANGDGLDANGSITQTGGNIVVVGTTSNGNGALDYDKSFNVSGGSLVVYGSTGMWQNPSNTSTQYSICFSASGNSGDKIEIKDSNGNIVSSFTTERSYSAILISNSDLKEGETYTLYVNGSEKSSLEVTGIVTSQISGGGMMGGGMQPGGMQPGGMPTGGNRMR